MLGPMHRVSETMKNSVLYRSSKVLSKSDKRKLFAVVIIQIMLGALDLVGVGLIGVIGSLAISGVGSRQPGNRVQWLLDQLNLGSYDLQKQATILGILAVSVMVLKTVLSMFFIRKILYFLSFKGARISSILVSRLLAQPLLTVQSRSNSLRPHLGSKQHYHRSSCNICRTDFRYFSVACYGNRTFCS